MSRRRSWWFRWVFSVVVAVLVHEGAAQPLQPMLERLSLSSGRLVTLEVPADRPERVEIDVELGDAERTLALEAFDLRADGFRVIVHGPEGIADAVPPPARTYRGHLLGRPSSRVAASLHGGQLHACIRDGDRLWFVQPAGADGVAATTHVVYARDEVVDTSSICGVQTPPGTLPVAEAAQGGVAGTSGCEARTQIAFDADFSFYELNGSSVADTVADIEAILNSVDFIYASQLGIAYELTAIMVQADAAADPYTQTAPNVLLDDFRTFWNENLPDVPRSVAHLMTGDELDGPVIGIAYLGVVCFPELAYGLSESRFSENVAHRVEVTAHELGHNWNALHCDEDPDCGVMCSTISGCSGAVNLFGDRSRQDIAAYASSVDCLDTSGRSPIDTGGELLATLAVEGDGLGNAVALDGPTAVLGAFMADSERGEDTGAAYVFALTDGTWSEQQKLVADDGEPGDRFGISVGLSGARAVVGAFLDDDVKISAGSAYVFRFDGKFWLQDQKLQADMPFNGDQFGTSAAIHGDWIAVGAPADDQAGVNAGAVYVFQFIEGGWQQVDKLVPEDAMPGDWFGTSVSLSEAPDGLVLVGGARFADVSAGTSGAAWVYRLGEKGWTEEAMLAPIRAPSGAEFGISVSVDGNVAVIGAFREFEDGLPEAGAAYVFQYFPEAKLWAPQARLTATSPGLFDRFGVSVAVQHPFIAVGGYLSDGTAPNAGAVSLFEQLDGGSWTFVSDLATPDPAEGDQLGIAVDLDAGAVLAGAWLHDHAAADAGAAYVIPLDAGLVDCNQNEVPDSCDLALGASTDCNANGVPDECDVATGTLTDADGNGFPDECDTDCNENGMSDFDELQAGASDCNDNGVIDSCDIADGTSADLDGDGLPDECGEDCNGNGIPDDLDVQDGTSSDCDGNGIPDECDLERFRASSGQLSPIGDDFPQVFTVVDPPLALGPVEIRVVAHGDFSDSSEYVNLALDGIVVDDLLRFGATACPLDDPEGPGLSEDDLDIDADQWNAALGDGVIELLLEPTSAVNAMLCETAVSFIEVTVEYAAGDCNGNGELDACEKGPDCNANGVPDACEADCNGNGVPDGCDIGGGGSIDCNGDGVPDECEPDCNGNGQADPCDIADGISSDADGNGVPDECETPSCPEDIDGDGVVEVDDLIAVILAWGTLNRDADVTDDGQVSVDDLIAILLAWGECD